MRQHGQAVTYRFGIDGGSDSSKGCRCDECRAAVREYEKRRRQQAAPAYVAATAARDHIAWLATQGVGLKQIAKVSGVSHGALSKIVHGVNAGPGRKARPPSKRIRPETSAKILAVTPSQGADGSRIPAGPVWADVERLLARGWTKRSIARAIGSGDENGLQLGTEVVTRRNATAIRALLDQPVPATVGRAWSAHHQAAGVEEEEAEAPDLDEHDRMTLALVEVLEARIDQNAWRRRSACAGKPAWMFFPTRGDHRTVAAAKAVCATCPVSAECLDANRNERDGVYGGLSARERRDLRTDAAA